MSHEHPGASSAQPTISVVIPTHNRPALLQDALASVLSQTVPPAEVIIVDDASSPPAELPECHDGITMHLLRHEQTRGGAAAKNTGARAARGNLIAFLDDDDLWAPTYLEHASGLLARHTEIDVLFMAVDWFGRDAERGERNYQKAMRKLLADADGKRLAPGVLGFGNPLVQALLRRVPMAFQRPVVRRDAFLHIGRYTEHCLLWDCDWALRAALVGKVALNEAPLYRQRVDAQGYSSHPTREIDQTLSNIEIRERLAGTLAAKDAATRALRRAFKRSAGENWHHLAYQLQLRGETGPALKAWTNSLGLAHQRGNLRLLLRILMRVRDRKPGGSSDHS